MTAGRDTRCIAIMSARPHFLRSLRCTREATQEVGGYAVCGTHARVAKRWQDEGRLNSMVEYWWSQRLLRTEAPAAE